MLDQIGLAMVGVTVGLQYGLLALGLVLVWRASRFINFAHGQIGVLGSFVLGGLVLEQGFPYWLALLAALVFGGLFAALIERRSCSSCSTPRGWSCSSRASASRRSRSAWARWRSPRSRSGRWTCPGSPTRSCCTWAVERYPVPFDGGLDHRQGRPVVAAGADARRGAAHRRRPAAAVHPHRARHAPSGRRPPTPRPRGWPASASARPPARLGHRRGAVDADGRAAGAADRAGIDVSQLGPTLLVRGLAAALLAGMVDFRLAFLAGIGLGVVENEVLFKVVLDGLERRGLRRDPAGGPAAGPGPGPGRPRRRRPDQRPGVPAAADRAAAAGRVRPQPRTATAGRRWPSSCWCCRCCPACGRRRRRRASSSSSPSRSSRWA